MYSTKDVSRYDYLRGRPFLVIEAIMSCTSRPERKGWVSDPFRIGVSERTRLVKRISNRTMRTASVIIDIQRDAVVKNNLSNDNAVMLAEMKAKHASLLDQGRAMMSATIKQG